MCPFDLQSLQLKYETLLQLHQQLKQAQQQWKEAQTLVNELTHYYQHEQWIYDHQADISLHCNAGAHSILSEDAMWNTIADNQTLAIEWMRLGLDALDK